MGTSYSWGDSDWTQEKNISQWELAAIGIISPGKWWIPQYWTLLRFSWTGCWAILSRPCFCQERLDQIIVEVPSNLVFYDSICSRENNVLTDDIFNMKIAIMPSCKRYITSSYFYWFEKVCIFKDLYWLAFLMSLFWLFFIITKFCCLVLSQKM